MPDKNPFSPSSGLAFLTGLTGSMMSTFKENADRERKDDAKAQDTDFKLLMAALEQLKPDLTPSQAQDILSRAVDIYKPKGHGGIKSKLGELFGRGEGYNPQAGGILSGVSKPKVDVGTVTGSQEPSKLGDVTLPPPPEMSYKTTEKTYRQLDQEDVANKYGLQLQKQLTLMDQAQQDRLERDEAKNKLIIDRVTQLYGYKVEADAEKDLLRRSVLYNPNNPRDPDAIERAARDLQQEADVKKQYLQTRIEYQKKRLTQIDEGLSQAQQRIAIAEKNAGGSGAKTKDPQVQQAWSKVNQYLQAEKTLRVQISMKYAAGTLPEDPEVQKMIQQAELFSQKAQEITNFIEQRVNSLRTGTPVSTHKSSTKRGGVKLTEAEIRANGGTDKDVQEARDKGVLAP